MATDERSGGQQRIVSNLRPDVGPVDKHALCETGHCDRKQRYRVPWPQFGSDVALCDFHLARYRHINPEIWGRIRALDDVEDPDRYAVIGNRFLTLDEVPEEIAVDGEKMRRVALCVDGWALFDSAEPDDDGTVRFVTVNRGLEPRESIEIHRSSGGEFVDWFRQHEGIHELDPEARRALHGGETDVEA
ncbi:hypothetical protein [Halorubrum sp. F4]|uniref:hypothetical protein n=1 Tax=Halorubrum sp. F4 TaxID=2989715 RepID=UPI00247FC612|nr:hypothetical protein [Halorubrum sp. F4]